jgi:hypothetical protein
LGQYPIVDLENDGFVGDLPGRQLEEEALVVLRAGRVLDLFGLLHSAGGVHEVDTHVAVRSATQQVCLGQVLGIFRARNTMASLIASHLCLDHGDPQGLLALVIHHLNSVKFWCFGPIY